MARPKGRRPAKGVFHLRLPVDAIEETGQLAEQLGMAPAEVGRTLYLGALRVFASQLREAKGDAERAFTLAAIEHGTPEDTQP